MNNLLRKEAVKEITSNIHLLDNLKKYYNLYPYNSKFFYEEYTIFNDVIAIDISSFNVNFLIICNCFIKSETINKYISYCNSLIKKNRVVEFGYLYKCISVSGIELNKYMIAVRNYFFSNFFKLYTVSSKSLNIKRINYDDIEFITFDSNISPDIYINNNFLSISKFEKYDYVIVLNKRDGVFYVNGDDIVNIKYTSGWVNVPAYYKILNYVIKFIIGKIESLEELNLTLFKYIEYADQKNFFKYNYDELSNSFEATDLVTDDIKYLFIANVMNKFSPLMN